MKDAASDRRWTSPLLSTDSEQQALRWDQVQRDQVDLAWPLEIPVFYGSEHWHRANRVLDVGTGNGFYVSRLRAQFPHKEYAGIDVSDELIAKARSAAGDGITFQRLDFYDATGTYDCQVMRLFLQHQRNALDIIRHAATLSARRGALIIFDACDEQRLFWPDVPEFRRFFAAHSEQQLAQGCDRGIAKKIGRGDVADPAWNVIEHRAFIVPSTLPGNLSRFRRVYETFIDMVERTGTLTCDFERVKSEWRRWCALDHAYTQIGVTSLVLERR